MNGLVYFCDGCDRLGHADEFAPYYECPVCRWIGPLTRNTRRSVQALVALAWRRYINADAQAADARIAAVYPDYRNGGQPVRPDTFELTLPSGQNVRCWQRQREAIREERRRYGSIMLVNSEDPEVYRFIPRADPEYAIRASTARSG